jgi:hypothetical protein
MSVHSKQVSLDMKVYKTNALYISHLETIKSIDGKDTPTSYRIK